MKDRHSSHVDEEPILELPKTGLIVFNGQLQRVSQDGGVLLRLPIDQIEAVHFRMRFDVFSLIFSFIGVGLGAIGRFVSESNILTSLLYVAGVLGIGFGLLGFFGYAIVIHSSAGITRVNCIDSSDEGHGFVTSLRLVLDNKH